MDATKFIEWADGQSDANIKWFARNMKMLLSRANMTAAQIEKCERIENEMLDLIQNRADTSESDSEAINRMSVEEQRDYFLHSAAIMERNTERIAQLAKEYHQLVVDCFSVD